MNKKIIIFFSILFFVVFLIVLLFPKDTTKPLPVIDSQFNFYFTDVALELKKGDSYEANIEYENGNPNDYVIEFSSNNSDVATIDENGVILAIDYGIAIITASLDSEVITSIEVSVLKDENNIVIENVIPIQKVDIIQEEINIKSNEKYQLKTNIYPSNATNKSLMFETNDSRVAEVTDQGLVIGRIEGTTTINVYSNNEKTDVVTVKVTSPTVSLSSITLMPSDVILNIGESYQFKPSLIPVNVTGKVAWTSSNNDIATVNSNGLVTAKKEGTIVITATCEGKTSSANITVKNEKLSVIVAKIIFDKKSVVLKADETIKINPTIMPSNATNKKLIWNSSNNSIATVSNDGTIKGISKGTAIITAKSINGITNTINVTVTSTITSSNPNIVKPNEIILNTSDFSLEKGKTKQLKTTILPLNSIDQNVTWISSNESVATVNSNGLVTAKKIGDTTIAVMTNNGKIARTKITVTSKPVTPQTSAKYYGNGNIPERDIAIINEHLYDFLEEAAYKARKTGRISERKAKVAAAAYFLIYNPYYKVRYGYGRLSKYNYEGWNPIWSNTVGVECQGFVTWSLIQAGLPLGTEVQYYPARITQIDANSYWTVDYILSIPGLEIGDVLNRRYPRDEDGNKTGNGHWAVIIDINKEKCELTVAHATSVKEGLHLSTYKCGTTIHYNRAFNTDKY